MAPRQPRSAGVYLALRECPTHPQEDPCRSSKPSSSSPAVIVQTMPDAPTAPLTLAVCRHQTNADDAQLLGTSNRRSDGKRVLRPSEFATSDGPDGHMYLAAAGEVEEEATVNRVGFVDRGAN